MKIIFLAIFGFFLVNVGFAEVPKSDNDEARLVSPKCTSCSKGRNEEGIKSFSVEFKHFQRNNCTE